MFSYTASTYTRKLFHVTTKQDRAGNFCMVNKVFTHVVLIVSSSFLILLFYLFFPTTLSHLSGVLCLTSLTERDLLACNLNFYLAICWNLGVVIAINVCLFLTQILGGGLALIFFPLWKPFTSRKHLLFTSRKHSLILQNK